MHKVHQSAKNVSGKEPKCPGKCSRFPEEVIAYGPKKACIVESTMVKPSKSTSASTKVFHGRMELDMEYKVHSLLASNTVWVYDNKQSQHSRCQHAQELRWNWTVLPQLIYPYMAYHHLYVGSQTGPPASTPTVTVALF